MQLLKTQNYYHHGGMMERLWLMQVFPMGLVKQRVKLLKISKKILMKTDI